MDTHPVILAAGDDGPRHTLRPLAETLGVIINDGADPSWTREAQWQDLIRARKPRGLVCGTSDSPAGRAVEASARRAAVVAGIPIVIIEDYPGNYYEVSGGSPDLLIVESAPVAALTLDKFGSSCPQTKALGLARYDPLRHTAPERRSFLRYEGNVPKARISVLWAGQPETNNCLTTLKVLLPIISARGIELLFKAHPRDTEYGAGAYRALLENAEVAYRDVTHLSVKDALLLSPKLVITQFSSTAIEAGFFGIPSLNVLLPDAGGTRLLEKKGYRIPPHCAEGAAGYAMHSDELACVLDQLIDDNTARENLIRCFDSYFCTHELMLPHLSALVENFFQNKGIPP